MRLIFYAFAWINNILRRVVRVMIGRSRRLRICRMLMGNGEKGRIRIVPLDQSNVSVWERYLSAPVGHISLPLKDVYMHIALSDESVVGHVSVFKQWGNTPVNIDGWWLTGLEVNPRWRCVGLGRRLVTSIVTEWRSDHGNTPLYLVVHKNNKPAIRLFESFGFRLLNNPDWEMKLQKAYRGFSHGSWNYRIMECPVENRADN